MPKGIKGFEKGYTPWNKNKTISAEIKAKISKNNARVWLGRKLSDEHKQKISQNRTGKDVGRVPSLETRRKISVAQIGKKLSKNTKHKISNSLKGKFGNQSRRWKGGTKINSYGYKLISCPNHPFHDVDNRVFEHRIIMEKKIGRYLHRCEIVHHINKIKTDNRPENLMLFTDRSAHSIYHAMLRRKK